MGQESSEGFPCGGKSCRQSLNGLFIDLVTPFNPLIRNRLNFLFDFTAHGTDIKLPSGLLSGEGEIVSKCKVREEALPTEVNCICLFPTKGH